jgi:hypothetical protein
VASNSRNFVYRRTPITFDWANDVDATIFGNVVKKVFADSPYTATTDDREIHVDTSGGAVTIKLPATPQDDQPIFIKKITGNANTLTIDGNGKTMDNTLTTWGTGATVNLFEFRFRFNAADDTWWSR